MDDLNRVISADQGVQIESSGSYSVDADWRWRGLPEDRRWLN